MVRSFRCVFLCLSLVLVAHLPAFAGSDWTQPTPEQLKETSDPAAPGAEAVYLDLDERVDNRVNYYSVSATVKILTEKGKTDFSDIEIPYPRGNGGIDLGDFKVVDIEARTLEPDGTVVPFAGKPYDKEVVKVGGVEVMEKVFTMPNVQVGSILQYHFQITFSTFVAPWYVLQQPVFVHHAHYYFMPADIYGHVMYTPSLPPGAKVKVGLAGYDLTVDDVPAAPDEEYMPPVGNFSYRLLFYYTSFTSETEFWEKEGESWSRAVDRYVQSSDKLRAVVSHIIGPNDTDDQKAEKIYAAVMGLENTRFTRQHTETEDKAENEKVKTAADIWADKRGTANQIALLFVALARAAGLKAYVMLTTSRNDAFMNPHILDWGQLTDEIAIVNIDGKDEYFDPGERYCEFGKLAWVHTQMLGIRQTDNGTEQATAPPGSYTDNETFRRANLTVGADGTVQGQIVVTMKGVEALRWRQRALRADAEAANKDFEKEMQSRVPDGVQVKMDGFDGLTDYTTNLVATLDVSGTMGTKTGKRVFLPASFFEANVKPPFAEQKRENPIDMRYPFAEQDQVAVALGPGLKLESAPTGATIPLAKGGAYKTVYSQTADGYTAVRLLALGNTIFKQDDYSMLRTFFQSGATQDQQQVVLVRQ